MPSAFSGSIERVSRDALDADPGEDVLLEGELARRATSVASADLGVLALGVLAHDDHVDPGSLGQSNARLDAVELPDGAQVHVLVEGAADRDEQSPE